MWLGGELVGRFFLDSISWRIAFAVPSIQRSYRIIFGCIAKSRSIAIFGQADTKGERVKLLHDPGNFSGWKADAPDIALLIQFMSAFFFHAAFAPVFLEIQDLARG